MTKLSKNSLNTLLKLPQNRHALAHLPACEYQPLFTEITALLKADAAQVNAQTAAEVNAWYLIGTDGCHLCDYAYRLIQQALHIKTTRPASLIRLDLADSTDDTLIDTLGIHIPILLTPTKLLPYPFSIMDIMALD